LPTSRTDLTYDVPGATAPGDVDWRPSPTGFRRWECHIRIGAGEADWAFAADTVLRWGVKTRSGFEVHGSERVLVDQEVTLLARIGPFRLREPARVVAVVERTDRCGFAYGTRAGHPVSGEEAFIVHRSADGTVWLTLRSLTRPGQGLWKLAFPVILVAQRWYRRRYRRSLIR
jgi:uncharacterized protein (UPF0548 family)